MTVILAVLPFPDTQPVSVSLAVLSGYTVVETTLVKLDMICSISDFRIMGKLWDEVELSHTFCFSCTSSMT